MLSFSGNVCSKKNEDEMPAKKIKEGKKRK